MPAGARTQMTIPAGARKQMTIKPVNSPSTQPTGPSTKQSKVWTMMPLLVVVWKKLLESFRATRQLCSVHQKGMPHCRVAGARKQMSITEEKSTTKQSKISQLLKTCRLSSMHSCTTLSRTMKKIMDLKVFFTKGGRVLYKVRLMKLFR